MHGAIDEHRAPTMPLASLLTELRESVLDICTARELTAVKAVNHSFRTSARAALGKSRFQERKEAAVLGELLLEAHDEDWFRQGSRPPEGALADRLSEMMEKYWSNEREVSVGTLVAPPNMSFCLLYTSDAADE